MDIKLINKKEFINNFFYLLDIQEDHVFKKKYKR